MAYLTSCSRCSSKNVSVCSTSRAKWSLLSSLRVILATKTSDVETYMVARPEAPGRSAILWGYVPENPRSSRLYDAQFSHADDRRSFASAGDVDGRERVRQIHPAPLHRLCFQGREGGGVCLPAGD